MINSMQQNQAEKTNRYHCRLPLSLPIRLERADTGDSIVVQNRDISWGGVRFAAPKQTCAELGSVTLEFPWANGKQFSATAEIVRTEPYDDRQDLVAARFSNLSAKDQKRLEKLLQMLQSANEDDDQGQPLAPVLEILVGDAAEMHAKLAELSEGHLSVTVVEAYHVNQSIQLIINDNSDRPPIKLRARVTKVAPVSLDTESTWSIFDLELRFEHPLDELTVTAQSRLRQSAPYQTASQRQGDPTSSNGQQDTGNPAVTDLTSPIIL